MPAIITPDQDPYKAAGVDLEMLHRVLCRESLIAYIRAVAPWYTVEEVHCVIAAHLEALAAGDIDRLMISLFPRGGKSTTASVFFPSWYAGKFPSDKILQVGHKVELSRNFSLDVRELMGLPQYRYIFPGVQLAKAAKAAGRWRVEEITKSIEDLHRQRSQQGEYNAAGVTSGIAGVGFHLGICDDLISEQDKDSKLVKDRVWNWWGPGFYTRRQPERNGILLMGCLTGDTPITMGNGTRRRIDRVKPGDIVQAWDNGIMRLAKVKDWRSCGEDDIFEVVTGNGTVRANARHPFLVKPFGEPPIWVKVSDLKVGDRVVHSGHEPVRTKPSCMTVRQAKLLGLMMGDGWVTKRKDKKGLVTCCALGVDERLNKEILDLFYTEFGVTPKRTRFGYVRTEVMSVGRWMRRRGVNNRATGKRVPKWMFCQPLYIRKAFLDGFVAADGHINSKRDRTEVCLAGLGLISDIRNLARAIGYHVTNICTRTREAQPPGSPKPIVATSHHVAWQNKAEEGPFYYAPVQSVKPAGREIVYDLEVEGFGNFIADGMVVHNTRWATDDPMGRLLAQKHHGADVWTVVNIPAILDKDSAKLIYTIAKEYKQIEDLHDFKPGDSASPRRWSLKELQRSRAQLTDRDWNALYMGNPQDDEGQIIKKKWWRLWPKEKPPECVFVFQMYDTAMEAKQSNDYSARTTWGVFEHKEREGERASFHMILLERWKDRVQTPELKLRIVEGCYGAKKTREAIKRWYPQDSELLELINEDAIAFDPDRVLIENKGGAIGLIHEMKRLKDPSVPVWPWKLPRGTQGELGKYARARLAQLLFEQGAVWYMGPPPGWVGKNAGQKWWAEEVIDECAACHFDGSDETDDLPDSCVAAAIYTRQTYRVDLASDVDEEEERQAAAQKVKRKFYGAR